MAGPHGGPHWPGRRPRMPGDLRITLRIRLQILGILVVGRVPITIYTWTPPVARDLPVIDGSTLIGTTLTTVAELPS